jgi:hypothetical protein
MVFSANKSDVYFKGGRIMYFLGYIYCLDEK